MKRRLRVAILAVALVAPSIANGAEADAEPVRVRFDAYPGCPDAPRFFDQIRARTVHVRLANDGEVARTLRVSVVRDHARSVGRVVIEEATQASVPRSV